MKTIVAYKENGIANMLAAGRYYHDSYRIKAENNSFYSLGSGVIMASSIDPMKNLSLKLIAERFLEEEEINLNMDFIMNSFIPVAIECFTDSEVLETNNGVVSLTGLILLIQGDKIFLIRDNLDTYQIDDYIVIGGEPLPLLTALNLGYNSGNGLLKQIVMDMKALDRNLIEARVNEMYHIDTKDLEVRRVDINGNRL